MALNTNTVTASFHYQGGAPRPGLKVQATLSSWDSDGGQMVSRHTNYAESDENGEISMELWPNTRGDKGTTHYVVSIRNAQGTEIIRGAATVPETPTPVDLTDIMELCQ